MTIGRYGPKVIGAEQAATEAVTVKKRAHIYGPKVGGTKEVLAKIEREAGIVSQPAPDTSFAALQAERDALRAEIEALRAAKAPEEWSASAQLPVEPQDDSDGGGAEEEIQAAAGADKYLSTRELDAAVKANPALVDGLLEMELAREPQPRPTALKSLLAAETSEAGGKRAEVVARINAALGAGE